MNGSKIDPTIRDYVYVAFQCIFFLHVYLMSLS
uniref:Uncharacterized protein n=1 Tax=Arundo donax TaxID=35708 RepID=A0A0A9A741_ARUDO